MPAASTTPTLSITAIAFDAGSVELARDTISVSVVVGVDVASRIFGVPLGGTRDLVLRLPVPRATALDVTLVSLDPAVASVAATPFTIPAGATELRVPITGVAEGATTLIASTLEDQVVIFASVSALAAGSTLDAVAAPAGRRGAAVLLGRAGRRCARTRRARFRSGSWSSRRVQNVPIVVSSSDAGVASVAGAGRRSGRLDDGDASRSRRARAARRVLQLVGGGTGRELRVVIGTPSAANTPPVVAPPVGIVIVPFSSAGDVIVPVSSTRTVTLRILDAPAAADTELVTHAAATRPSRRSRARSVIPAGSTDATFEITTGVGGQRDRHAGRGRRRPRAARDLGRPDRGRTRRRCSRRRSGITIVPFASAGDVVVPLGATRTVTLRILDAPARGDTALTVRSSDAGGRDGARPGRDSGRLDGRDVRGDGGRRGQRDRSRWSRATSAASCA